MSEAPEESALPEELVPRTAALLVRGGLAATGALLLAAAALAALIAASIAILRSASGAGLFAGGALYVGMLLVAPGVLHAAPLAAFARVVEVPSSTARVGLGAALRRTPAALVRLFAPIAVAIFLCGPLLVLATAVGLSALDQQESLAMRAVLVASAAVGALLAVWMYGMVTLVSGARAVLDGREPGPNPSWWDDLAVLATGGLTLGTAAAIVGGAVARELGRSGLAIPPELLLGVGVVAVTAAHVVSCAVAMAIASAGPERVG